VNLSVGAWLLTPPPPPLWSLQGVNLSVEAWLLKLMVGAIDPSYDQEDE
jgi:hypothetical protein